MNNLYGHFSRDLDGIENNEFPEYCRKKFKKQEMFLEEDRLNLKLLIVEILVAMYYEPSYFDELKMIICTDDKSLTEVCEDSEYCCDRMKDVMESRRYDMCYDKQFSQYLRTRRDGGVKWY